jgi:aspartyl-tRNA synthetase
MAIMSDFERVFEIGPVFRAENANTHRHMTEFNGLDMEMEIKEHYHEVLDMLEGVFLYIFDGLNERYGAELAAVNAQFPFEPLVYKKPSLRLKWPQIVALLRKAGVEIGDLEDMDTPSEKLLGKLVKAEYGVDFYLYVPVECVHWLF